MTAAVDHADAQRSADTRDADGRSLGQERRRVSSFLGVAKNTSQTALSSARPLAPIEYG
jgi:hypothetical protein